MALSLRKFSVLRSDLKVKLVTMIFPIIASIFLTRMASFAETLVMACGRSLG